MSRKITRLDDNFIKVNHLPKLKNGNIDWLNSVGEKLEFKYCGVFGILEIKNAERQNNKTFLDIEYENNMFHVETAVIQRCKLSKIISSKNYSVLIKWRYDIGDKVIDDLFVIDRRFKSSRQQYKITCKRCGFKSQEYYVVKDKKLKHYDEYWIESQCLHDLRGCPCCSKKSSIVVSGINDILTTDSWMIKYFSDKNDTKKYSSYSNMYVLMKCPDCKFERLYNISDLKIYGHLPCSCSDNYSIPNKFSYFLLKNLNDIKNYQREYSPSWLKPYRYDNYFEFNNKKYIVEMDGGFGHGKKVFGSNAKDTDGLNRDLLKDKLAEEHDITVIRINAEKSDLEFLKENIIAELSGTLDLTNVDWKYIYENATANIVKQVCQYAQENYIFVGNKKIESKYILEISKKFDIDKVSVVRFLKTGRKLGWCNYITYREKAKELQSRIYELYKDNREQSYEDIAKKLCINIWDVSNATSKLIKDNKIISRRQT